MKQFKARVFMKKLSRRIIFLLIISSPLIQADLNDTIIEMLGGGKDPEACQIIGKKGRTLTILPRSTKDRILKICEEELLLGKTMRSQISGFPVDELFSPLSRELYEFWVIKGLVHPRAWQALTNIQKYNSWDPTSAALDRINTHFIKKL